MKIIATVVLCLLLATPAVATEPTYNQERNLLYYARGYKNFKAKDEQKAWFDGFDWGWWRGYDLGFYSGYFSGYTAAKANKKMDPVKALKTLNENLEGK